VVQETDLVRDGVGLVDVKAIVSSIIGAVFTVISNRDVCRWVFHGLLVLLILRSVSVGVIPDGVVEIPVSSGKQIEAIASVLPEVLSPDQSIKINVSAVPHVVRIDPNFDLKVTIFEPRVTVFEVGCDLDIRVLAALIV